MSVVTMDYKQAWKLVGGLSAPSKMPCHGYSLPPDNCPTGTLLRKITGTVCSKCYAHKGRYVFPLVRNAMQRRLESITNEFWVDAMVFLIKSTKEKFFRWHDSGDVQNFDHLMKIFEVCRRTPEVKHWLPTNEKKLMKSIAIRHIPIPTNLVIRLSSCMIDKSITKKELGIFCGSSTFKKELNKERSKREKACTAYKRGGCKNCRICWDKSVKIVSYKMH